MKIAQLAPLQETVPPQNYGGTELVVSLITEGLIEAGHEVTLFASGDSQTSAKLVSVVEHSLRPDHKIPARQWSAYALDQLIEFEKHINEFDIVHNHMGYEALPALSNLRVPSISTNHNPVKPYCAPIYLRYKDLPYVSISNAYQRLNFPDDLNYVATIYNGIDLSAFNCDLNAERSYLLFLGRVCHDKGTLESIEIAERLKLPLKIAGKIDDADYDYFEQFIKPRLSQERRIEYIGEVDFSHKLELYSHAIAITYPINFEEPFGLVMIEALAAGTPIMAFDRGSVSELLIDGKNGIVANTVDDLVARFQEVLNISHSECRQRAVHFSKERMVSSYISLYESLCR